MKIKKRRPSPPDKDSGNLRIYQLGKKPGQESPATKRYWALWDSLHLKDGVLYRRWESDEGSSCPWQLILPKSRIQEVLRETHDSASGGHFEVMKTLSKILQRFYWDRLRPDVEKWCRECHA
ncbi:hypothetical protein AVEN_54129-1 [Araneus ventricosus]|uniref:Integrase zinc-binding domain-containing protein n=1 Tax=Araneus ventricosus TaxID=182803 RepID=A0A4Y2BTY2_ARAVE|nr:hypothetical protein AVEN_54129-1 [Araneus ventricosus]